MKIQNLAAVLLRVLALYFLYVAFTSLIHLYKYIASDGQVATEITILMIFTVTIFPLIGFVLFWIFPNSIAQLIVKPSNNDSIKPMASVDWLRIIIISMGVFITTRALFDIIYWISAYQMMSDNEAWFFMSEQKASMITTVVELIVGFILISKNTWLSHALLKINAPESADVEAVKAQSD